MRLVVASMLMFLNTANLVFSEEMQVNAIDINYIAGRSQGGFRISYTLTNTTGNDLCIPRAALNDEVSYSVVGMLRALYKSGAEIPHPSSGMPCYAISEDLCRPAEMIKISPGEQLQSSLAVANDYFFSDTAKINKVQLRIMAIPRCDLLDSQGRLPERFTRPRTDAFTEAEWFALISEETPFDRSD